MVKFVDSRTPSLLSYKYFIRPTVHKLYGDSAPENKHQKNVQEIIRMLAKNGPMTTWEMAKLTHGVDMVQLRTKEKEYRRLLKGRVDRGQTSQGIIDLNLVVVDGVSTKRNPGNYYRLSLFGILYCLDVLRFNHDEIDLLAKNYREILPFVFGKWEFLKSILGNDAYMINMLGKGMLFDNPNLITILNPAFFELITYFNIKSNTVSTSLNEKKLAELISLWFYISLLYFPPLTSKKKIRDQNIFLKKVLDNDKFLNDWFTDFLTEAQSYYDERSKLVRDVSIV